MAATNTPVSRAEKIIRKGPLLARIGISKSELYRRMAAGTFPKSVALGPRAVGWFESDIEAWLNSLAKRGEA